MKPILWAFSKVCVFIDFDPSTRHRYCCVFKSFHSGDRFRVCVFIENDTSFSSFWTGQKRHVAATKCRTHIPSPRVTCTCDMSLRQGQSGVQYNKIYFTEAKISFVLSSRLVPWSQRFSFASHRRARGLWMNVAYPKMKECKINLFGSNLGHHDEMLDFGATRRQTGKKIPPPPPPPVGLKKNQTQIDFFFFVRFF